MHCGQNAQRPGAQHPCGFVQTLRNPCIAALQRLQGHCTKSHQIGPDDAKSGCGHVVAHLKIRVGGLHPAHRQQQPHHHHRPGYCITQAGQPGRQLWHPMAATPCTVGQAQRQQHGQNGCHGGQTHTVNAPLYKTRPGQRVRPRQQWPQHEQHRKDEAHQNRCQTEPPSSHGLPPAQGHRLRVRRARTRAFQSRETHCALGALFQRKQYGHQHQQHGGQLRCGNAVVHGKPGLIDAGGEGLDPEVAGHTEIGQRFHQCQRHTSSHCRPCQRQSYLTNTAAQRGAHQARGFHQLRGPLPESRPCKQINIGIQRKGKHPSRTPDAAYFRQHAPFQARQIAHRGLQRAAVLQEITVGVGHHIGRHGQWQQQGPLKKPFTGEVKQRHRGGSAEPESHHPHRHQGAQQDRGGHIVRQDRARHFTQNGQGCSHATAPRHPRGQHGQHREHQRTGKK